MMTFQELGYTAEEIGRYGNQALPILNKNRVDFDFIIEIDWMFDRVHTLSDVFESIKKNGFEVSEDEFLEHYKIVNKSLGLASVYSAISKLLKGGSNFEK